MTTGEIWWTILVDHVRVGVKASTPEDAFRIFIEDKYPQTVIKQNGVPTKAPGRRMPPKRADCNIRQALAVEVEAYQNKRRTLPLTQDSALFDRTTYDRPKVRTKEGA